MDTKTDLGSIAGLVLENFSSLPYTQIILLPSFCYFQLQRQFFFSKISFNLFDSSKHITDASFLSLTLFISS